MKKDNHKLLVLIVFFDLILLILSFFLARYFSFSKIELFNIKVKEIIVSFFVIIILYIGLENFEFTHSYRFNTYIHIFRSVVYFELFLLSVFYAVRILNIYEDYFDRFVFYYALTTFSIIFIERILIKIFSLLLRMKGFDQKKFLVVGAGGIGTDFYKTIEASPELGIKIIGFLDDDKNLLKTKNPAYSEKIRSLIIGTTEKLELLLKTKTIDNIIIALSLDYKEKIISTINLCEKYGIKAELIPRFYRIITENPSIRKLKKYTLIGVRSIPLENLFNRFIKRLIDFTIAFFGLFISFPLFILIMICIKLESKGPILFRQKRTGYNQKEFEILKFRTMMVNPDADKKQATADDPRKTAFGDFLRKTNLDEIPQLICILKGDMSLIGPRPHMLAHTKEFTKLYDKYLIRHWVKPGLTGWAQVNGWRGDSDIGVRIKFDLEYIEKWSLWFDLKILFLTIFGKKVKKHAY